MGAEADEPPAATPPLLADHQFRAALDAMLDHVAIGRAIRGPDGAIEDFVLLYMNPQSIDGAGRRGAEMVGRRVLDLYPNWPSSGLMDAFSGVVETGRPFEVDRMRYEDVAADGRTIAGYWSISVVRFGDGYIAASRDVTHLVEAERSRVAIELLQRAALPERLPAVAGAVVGARYEPAVSGQPVGGDWYDGFVLADGRLGLVIADVAGHGHEAAAHMVQVRNLVRALVIDRGDPGEALARSAAVLGQLGEQPLFATCCCATIDLDRRLLTWASAGHVAPVLVRGEAQVLQGAVAPPLGVDATAVPPSHQVELMAGDRLVLFTDGLVERRGEPLDASLDALLAWLGSRGSLPAQELADALAERDGWREDDLAVLCVALES